MIAVVLVAIAAGAQACSGDAEPVASEADASASADASAEVAVTVDAALSPACVPGKRECLDGRVGRICPSDGAAWIPFACHAGETCAAGACTLDPVAKHCTAGATECVGDKIVRTCVPDGSAWLPSTCSDVQSCVAGTCKTTETTKCTAGTALCVDGAAYRCKADGSGYETTACPTGTKCEAGWCKGAVCDLGASSCVGANAVQSCVDGKSFATKSCLANESCVPTGTGTAACKTNQCAAGATACGNKLDPTADPAKWTTACTATADGYQWVPTQCQGILTCRAGMGGFACSSECVPGQTTCTFGGYPYGSQSVGICGDDGKWGTPTACTSLEVCSYDPATQKSQCVDQACQYGAEGICTFDGLVKKCVGGKLEVAGTPCEAGACTNGKCAPACVDGDTSCQPAPGGGMQLGISTCVSGKWQQPTSVCGTGTSCINVFPNKKAVCGDTACLYGQSACTSDGKVRPCKEGKLVPESEAVACQNGGKCIGSYCQQPECIDGDTSCTYGGLYRVCKGGYWAGDGMACPASEAGLPQTCVLVPGATGACRDCQPGIAICASSDAGVSAAVRRCTPDGYWASPEPCLSGVCQYGYCQMTPPDGGQYDAMSSCSQCAAGVCNDSLPACAKDLICSKFLACADQCSQVSGCTKDCAAQFPSPYTETLVHCIGKYCLGSYCN